MTRMMTPEKVQAAPDPAKAYSEYVQQSLGIPYPTLKDLMILRGKAKVFFANYPNADWVTLCKLVPWAANRKKRYPRVWMLVDEYRLAWSHGVLPELDPNRARNKNCEDQIEDALEKEDDPEWRRRLMLANGKVQQEEVLTAWLNRPRARS